jgi:hypothetical protein
MKKTDLDKLIPAIHSAGYRAERGDGEIISSGNGLNFFIIPYSSKSIQFRCGISVDENADFDFKSANDFNKKNRFSKIYLIDDIVIIESDHRFDFDECEEIDERGIEKLKGLLMLWERSLSFFKIALFKDESQGDDEIE